jgi:hypothetical protein
MPGKTGDLIEFMQYLNGDGFSEWAHAVTYIGNGRVIQAEPGGATIVSRGMWGGDIWSTGIIKHTPEQQAMVAGIAGKLLHTPYSWLDYAALTAHRAHLPVPGLRNYIGATGHQICSQMVDHIELLLGVHLFTDGRWEGDVTPGALGNLLRSKGAVVIPGGPQ